MPRLRPYADSDWKAVLEVDVDTKSASIGVSAVHPARQCQGIGTLMYEQVLDAMRAQGIKYVTADTGGDSFHAPARRAYQKLGFVAVPVVHHYKCLLTPEPADAGQERRADADERGAARPPRPRNSSGSRGGRKRR
jgi:hypothetical protein